MWCRTAESRLLAIVVFTVGLWGMPLSAAAADKPGDPVGMARLVPAEIQGWKPAGPGGVYSADTLYDLIDGAAEVYRALNVRRVLSRRYVKEGAPDIYLDVFDMGSSQDAFGAFHHDMREGPTAGIGQESELAGANLSFWKGRYFVSIVPFDDSEAMRRAVLGLGEAVAAAIPEEGPRPDLLELLPEAGLISSQIHYFHDGRLLARHVSLGRGNPLQLDDATEGILARYRLRRGSDASGPSAPQALLLIRYPSPVQARHAQESAAEYLTSPDAEFESERWVADRVLGDVFVAVLEATPGEARTLLDAVEALERSGHGGQ